MTDPTIPRGQRLDHIDAHTDRYGWSNTLLFIEARESWMRGQFQRGLNLGLHLLERSPQRGLIGRLLGHIPQNISSDDALELTPLFEHRANEGLLGLHNLAAVDLASIAKAPIQSLSLSQTSLPAQPFTTFAFPNRMLLLDISGCRISRATGLEHFTSLRELSLNDNALTSLPAASFNSLSILTLSENHFRDLSGINAPVVTQLSVNGNQLESADNLPHAPNVRHLNLDDNPIVDIAALIQFPKLTTLSLDIVPANDLSVIPLLPQLTSLTYTPTVQTADLTSLASTAFTHLSLDLGPLIEPSDLGSASLPMGSLKRLSIKDGGDILLAGTKRTPLVELRISGGGNVSLPATQGLQKLSLRDIHIEEEIDLSRASSLKYLSLQNIGLGTIPTMIATPRVIRLNNNHISDITPLADKKLRIVSLRNNPISTIKPLIDSHTLRLDIGHTNVSNLWPIIEHPPLELWVDHCPTSSQHLLAVAGVLSQGGHRSVAQRLMAQAAWQSRNAGILRSVGFAHGKRAGLILPWRIQQDEAATFLPTLLPCTNISELKHVSKHAGWYQPALMLSIPGDINLSEPLSASELQGKADGPQQAAIYYRGWLYSTTAFDASTTEHGITPVLDVERTAQSWQ